MYVVCPSCQDSFKIHSGHLAVAQGHVRCGGCRMVFDATASLYDSLEEAGAAIQRLRTAEEDINGVVDVALATIGAETAALSVASKAETATATLQSTTGPAVVYGIDLDFYAQPVAGENVPRKELIPTPEVVILDEEPELPTHHISAKVWWGVAASVFLSFLLTGQYVWKERNRLAGDAQLRPWMERYCELLHCELPLRHDVSKIEILEREVRDHPRVKGALLVTATIVNDAPFVQSFPVFEISFSNMSGTPVSVRRFEPDEYLPKDKRAGKGFQPGEKTQLVLEILDPGKQAVSFQLNFL